MCVPLKTPKAPEPPKVKPAPTREAVASDAEASGAKRRVEQQGIFSNIRTSAFGDTNYGTSSEMVKFGSVGSIA